MGIKHESVLRHKLIKKIQDEIFDPSQLDKYCLLVTIGIRDCHICVLSVEGKKCLLIESYDLEGIRTVKDRLKLLHQLFSSHLFIRGGFWKEIKFSIKGHKFALIPRRLYSKESAPHFFSLNSTLNPTYERLYAHLHKHYEMVNVFAADHKLINWIQKLYPSKSVSIAHQSSALIEGGRLLHKDQTGKAMLFLMDKKVLHILVTEKNRLYYYNQFAVQESSEFIKYVVLVFKELGMNPKASPVTLYGNIPGNSTYVTELRKYIHDLKLGKRPRFIQYPYPFDDIPSHHYFDLLNICLCQGFNPL